MIYEMLWIKRAALIFGSTSVSMATVVALYLAGLGLGSWWSGRLTHKVIRPFGYCAIIELALAIYGLGIWFLFDIADALFAEVYRLCEGAMWALTPTRFALVGVLLLPPTALIGATLPLFVHGLVPSAERLDRTFSKVYALNTSGALLGCALTGFAFLPLLGQRITGVCAVVLNIVAMSVCLMRRYDVIAPFGTETGSAACAGRITDSNPTRPIRLLGFAMFALGFMTLLNEMVWARLLANILRNTVHTYTVSLSVVLGGSVLGALVYVPMLDRKRWSGLRLDIIGGLFLVASLLTLAMVQLPAEIWWWAAAGGIPLLALMLLPVSIIAGVLYVAIQLAAAGGGMPAAVIGRFNALNMVGCILGASVGGLVLLPVMGVANCGLLSASGACLTALLLLKSRSARWMDGVTGRPDAGRYSWSAWAPVLTLILIVTLPSVSGVKLPGDLLTRDGQVVAIAEGMNSTLALIDQDQSIVFNMDSAWQGSMARTHQVWAAHIPMLHAPDAKRVLVVGLGVGQTVERFLQYPIEYLDIVDLEPTLFEFLRKEVRSEWMDDERVQWYVEDGRNYIQHTQQRYDIVSLELGQPYRPGVEQLYTREFYEALRRRLLPGGIAVQFVPLLLLPPTMFVNVVHTFLSVFPEASLWYNTGELLLIGAESKRALLQRDIYEAALADADHGRDFDFSYWGGPRYATNRFHVLISGFLAAGADLRGLVASAGGHSLTDDSNNLAYASSNVSVGDLYALRNADLIARWLSSPLAAVGSGQLNSAEVQWAQAIRRLNLGDIAACNWLDLATERLDANVAADTMRYILAAERANPQSLRTLQTLAYGLAAAGQDSAALPYMRRLAALLPEATAVQDRLRRLEARAVNRPP